MHGLLEPEVLELLDVGTDDAETALDRLLSQRLGVDATRVPIGRREAALANLRLRSFGPAVAVRAACANCGEQLESALMLSDLPLDVAIPDSVTVQLDEAEFDVRLPTIRDVRDAGRSADPRRSLIERCLDRPLNEALIDDVDLVELAERAIEEADPLIDISLVMACPECEATSTMRLDLAAHLWSEIEAYGRRLTMEVHWLATRYGWTEPEVLALSPARRRAYLELA